MHTLPAEEYPGVLNSLQYRFVIHVFLKQKSLSQFFQQNKSELFIQLLFVREHVLKQQYAFDIKKPALEYSFWKTKLIKDRKTFFKRLLIQKPEMV